MAGVSVQSLISVNQKVWVFPFPCLQKEHGKHMNQHKYDNTLKFSSVNNKTLNIIQAG